MIRYGGMHVYFNTFLVCVLLACLIAYSLSVPESLNKQVAPCDRVFLLIVVRDHRCASQLT